MKKILKTVQKILLIVFPTIILWFILYFSIGERFPIYFTDRTFASYFPYILVFSTAVSIYGICILLIHSKKRKWINIVLFVCGLAFSSLPFFAYHGFLQNQCSFWNEKVSISKKLFISKITPSEEINTIQIQCIYKEEITEKTVFQKKFTPFLVWNQEINTEHLDTFWKAVE